MQYPHGDTPERRSYLMSQHPAIAREIQNLESAWNAAQTRSERIRLSDLHQAVVAKLYSRDLTQRTDVGTREPEPRPDYFEPDSNKNPYRGERPHGSRVSPFPKQ